ncbi:MAG: helix-turn-helix transcriptional regulator [Burkholderiaceae bacterium]
MVRDRQSVRSLSTPPGATRSARHGEQVGTLIRQWRGRRRLSQMALALDAGISTRHLSFVETGRSRPSPQLLLALAEQLEVPLRERNALLLAGGYAPRFAEHPIDSPVLAEVRQALSRLLRAHDPFPAFAVDRHWNVVLANGASHRMLSLLPAWLAENPVNLFRASLHPEGFAAMTENFAEWGGYLLDQLDRLVAEAAAHGDGGGLSALVEEVGRYPNVARLSAERKRDPAGTGTGDSLVLPCVMSFGGQRATLFTTIATLGAARDLTLSELRLELFYPADAETDALLRGWAADSAAPDR